MVSINVVSNEIGRRESHVNIISQSYRIRGKVARDHRNISIKEKVRNVCNRVFIRVLDILVISMQEEIADINIILMYSAIKIRAKSPPENSVLNPETSSLSPSAKSKGVRFVSARRTTNHINIMCNKTIMGGKVEFEKMY